jgi:hypothetical protein
LKSEELELPENLVLKKVGAVYGKKDNTVAVTFEVSWRELIYNCRGLQWPVL